MGVIKQGILGGFSGKVANIVGSSWKGIAYMKALPLSVANPRTTAQVAQRTKFTNVVDFAKEILSSIIKPLNDRFAVKMSGFNLFVQRNIDLFSAAMPAPAADLIIASGKMTITDMTELSDASGQATVGASWVDDSGTGYKLATDKAYFVVVNETTEEVVVSSAVNVRSDASTSAVLSADLIAGDVVNAYLVFLRDDGTIVSGTSFITGVSV